MPKKQPRNAFYFFMMDHRDQQRLKGIVYQNMAQIADAAGPLWRDASPAIRKKFEEKAKKEKQKYNVPELKYTSNGLSLAEIQQQEQELKEAEEIERQDIKNFVKLKSFNNAIINEDIYVMDINSICKIGPDYIIGESTILRFSLYDGIINNYHEIINTGYIPVGYASDIKLSCKELGLEMPDEMAPKSNYLQILANTIDYLKQRNRDVKMLPIIFTMPDKVEQVKNFIQQMCSVASEDDSLFRVYRLDLFFFTLVNAIKTRSEEAFPKESLAIIELKKDPFKYTPELGCEVHEAADKSIECTLSRTKRWAYTILDRCCPIVGIEMQIGKHLPCDYDMDSILTYKEQKRERAGPTVAASIVPSTSSNISIVSDHDSSFASQSTTKSTKRVHVPMRMPKTDYSQTIRVAPELTEANFPALSVGVGRGRGSLSSSMDKLKLNKK